VTAFPASLALAATFDEGLAAEYGTAVAEEARDTGANVLLGPAVDIARAPLGGRLPEALGEDPCLAGRLAAAEVRAIQDGHVIAMVKHFVGNNAETGRTGYATSSGRTPAVNTVVSERALQELYYPPFKAVVQRGRAGSVMGSYNRLNGVYACQHSDILRMLKDEWGWEGFVAPDFRHAVRDPVAAANAGLDIPGLAVTEGRTAEDFTTGAIPAERLDEIVRRILFAIFDAGLDEHPVPDAGRRPAAGPCQHARARRPGDPDRHRWDGPAARPRPAAAAGRRAGPLGGGARHRPRRRPVGDGRLPVRAGGSRSSAHAPGRHRRPGRGRGSGCVRPGGRSATPLLRSCRPGCSLRRVGRGRGCWASTGTPRPPTASRP